MKSVIQRVESAKVRINSLVYSEINHGLLVLIAFKQTDTIDDIKYSVDKIINMRIFSDIQGKMNLNLKQIKGSIIFVPQFTLYGSCLKGNRPNFMNSANLKTGEILFEELKKYCLTLNEFCIKFGVFRENMKIELINDGPVTLILRSEDKILKKEM